MDRDIRPTGRDKWYPRPWYQIGCRGKALVLLGITWIFLGLESCFVPSTEYLITDLWMDTSKIRGAAWIIVGAMAIGVAFRPKGLSDKIAWPLLYALPAWRAFMYFVAWVDYYLPGVGVEGFRYGWVYVIIFSLLAAFVNLLSGWAEPYPQRPGERRRGSRIEDA